MDESDEPDIRRRFEEIFGPDPDEHPLFQEMLADLKSGKRAKMSIMGDLDEAAEHKRQQNPQQPQVAPERGWHDASLSD